MEATEESLAIVEYNFITDIIESAVDDLIQKQATTGLPYGACDDNVQLELCRLCARDEYSLQDISELQLLSIAELPISGIDDSAACTKLCSECADFLEKYRDFRCRCEDAQRKIASLLVSRTVLPDFLDIDFTAKNTARSNSSSGSPQPEEHVASDGEAEPEPEPMLSSEFESESSSSEEEIIPVAPKPKPKPRPPKKPKKPDSRRRVVNGKLEWVCLDCEQVFGSCVKLKTHRQTCEFIGNENSKRLGPFGCEICDHKSQTLMGLRVHNYKHTREQGYRRKRRKPTVIQEPTKVCHVCGKIFTSLNSLKSHLVFHKKEKTLECDVCGKRFFNTQHLKDHKFTHSDKRQHVCGVCGKAYYTKSVLYRHRKQHQDDYRKYPCTVCPKRFGHPHQLRTHMMVHTGEFPHPCSQCTMKFRKPFELKRHFEKEHCEETDPLLQEETLEDIDEDPESPQVAMLTVETLQQLDEEEFVETVEEATVEMVEDPGTELTVMFTEVPQELPELVAPSAAATAIPQEDTFTAVDMLDEASREFAVECFPHHHTEPPHEEDDADFYSFIEC